MRWFRVSLGSTCRAEFVEWSWLVPQETWLWPEFEVCRPDLRCSDHVCHRIWYSNTQIWSERVTFVRPIMKLHGSSEIDSFVVELLIRFQVVSSKKSGFGFPGSKMFESTVCRRLKSFLPTNTVKWPYLTSPHHIWPQIVVVWLKFGPTGPILGFSMKDISLG